MAKKVPLKETIWIFKRDFSPWVYLAILFLSVVALYWQSLDNPIVFDTAQNFNSESLNGFYDNFNFFSPRGISYVTFGALYKIVQDDWYWHHLINLLFHGVNTCLIFVFLKSFFMTVLKESSEETVVGISWMACLGALFFAVNPVAVYAAAYLIQRTVLMATMFCLLALILHLRAVRQQKWQGHLLTVAAYFLAVRSKEHCIMLPGVILVMTLVLDPFNLKNYLKRYGWVFALFTAVAFEMFLRQKNLIATVYEPHGLGMIESANVKESVFTEKNAYPLSIITQAHMFFRYFYLWIIPDSRQLYIDIHLPFATSLMTWPETFSFVCFCLYPLLPLWLIARGGVRSLLGFGLAAPWCLFTTELSVVRLSEQFVLYRSYLWMICHGAFLPFIFSVKIKGRTFPRTKVLLSVIYLVVITVIAVDRLNSFDTAVRVWEDAVEKIRAKEHNTALYKSYRPFNNLAFALTSSGKLLESIPYFYEAVRINPNYVKARSNLGAVLTNQGRYQEAIEHFKHAVKLEPNYIDAHVGLGVCAAEQGNFEEAIVHYKNALKIKEDYPDANFNLGNAYLRLKDYANAAHYYQVATRVKSDFAESHYNLGIALINLGKILEAKKAFEDSLKVDPHYERSIKSLEIINNQILKLPPEKK